MNGFNSTETILKEIYESGGYIWKPINCNAKNHVLGCTLRDLAIEGFLHETDISKGWWIFEDSKLSYTITDIGLQKLGF